MVSTRALLLAVSLCAEAEEIDWNAPVLESERLQDQGRVREAEQVLLTALNRAEREASDERWTAAFAHRLGGLYYLSGRHADSERFYLRALKTWQRFAASNSHQLAVTANDLVSSYVTRGLFRKALDLFEGPLAKHMDALGADPQALRWRNAWAAVLLQNGRLQDAEALTMANLGHLDSAPVRDDFVLLASVNHLGIICSKTNRAADAAGHFACARDLAARLFPPDRPERLRPCLNLAEMDMLLGRNAEADDLFRGALDNARQNIAADQPFQAELRLEYAAALRRMKRGADAKKLEREAREILAQAAPVSLSKHTVDVSELSTR